MIQRLQDLILEARIEIALRHTAMLYGIHRWFYERARARGKRFTKLVLSRRHYQNGLKILAEQKTRGCIGR